MQLSFRQGIISYPTSKTSSNLQSFLIRTGSGVTLSTTDGQVSVSIAHKRSNYRITESVTIPNAWTNIPDVPCWLFWDIDTVTAKRTFGLTTVQPVTSPSEPANPVTNTHWYDQTQSNMRVRTAAGTWKIVIRVFAAKLYGTNTFAPLGSSPTHPFAGSQVSSNEPCVTGPIAYDIDGKGVKKSDGTFFTITDQFFTNGSNVSTVALEATILTAKATETLSPYSVVQWPDFGVVSPADYSHTTSHMLGFTVNSALFGEDVSIIEQGVVTNPSWNWSRSGGSLWVKDGSLVSVDPHITDPRSYPAQQPPVARVLSRSTVFFNPFVSSTAVGSGSGAGGPSTTINGLSGSVNVVKGNGIEVTTTTDTIEISAVPPTPPTIDSVTGLKTALDSKSQKSDVDALASVVDSKLPKTDTTTVNGLSKTIRILPGSNVAVDTNVDGTITISSTQPTEVITIRDNQLIAANATHRTVLYDRAADGDKLGLSVMLVQTTSAPAATFTVEIETEAAGTASVFYISAASTANLTDPSHFTIPASGVDKIQLVVHNSAAVEATFSSTIKGVWL